MNEAEFTTLVIEIDMLPPAKLRLNGRKRGHWRTQVRSTLGSWLWLAKLAMEPNIHLIPETPWDHVLCHVHFILPSHQRRDPDNYFPGVKEVIDDYIVGYGIIADDDFTHISYYVDGEVIPGQSKTIIRIKKQERGIAQWHGD